MLIREIIETDILIIGGGTAGCLAAVEAREKSPALKVTIMEKANIERSGCLAAGMNAINAYIHPGESPESFVKYVRYDARGIVREDLILSAAKEINSAVHKVEKWGLPIQKDEKGNPLRRGRWNIKINGESLKPIIARATRQAGVNILNRVAATNLILSGDQVIGALGFGVRDGKTYLVKAKATIVAAGGASGIYKPNNGEDAHHKIWYSPFNTGAGYALGIRAGAEMSGFEMRFIALRTKDIICPTGTLALGFGDKQINSRQEQFMQTHFQHLGGEGAPTCLRVYGPTREIKEGRGPCYMDTRHLSAEKVRELKQVYLDMYPAIVLYWTANEFNPSLEPIEISGTEPYIMGGHCQAGYWITERRETTLKGLYAAGDAAGGYSYKFVSGCFAEGILAARAAVEFIQENKSFPAPEEEEISKEEKRIMSPLLRFEEGKKGIIPKDMESRLQKIMDEYAGGAGMFYELNEANLKVAREKLKKTRQQIEFLVARDLHELMQAHEIIDRLDVSAVLIEHLLYRKETRWPGFQTRTDYPDRNDFNWLCFVNSRQNPQTGEIEIYKRPYQAIVPGDRYLPK